MKAISIIIFLVLALNTNTDKNYKASIEKYQKDMNAEFKNPETSPLSKSDIINFTKLDFYNIDKSYNIEALLTYNKTPKEFGMKTTTNRRPIYIKYAIAKFTLKGKEYKINIYQNVELSKKEEYKDYLFMLFTDKTSGKTSYGGGRYIDLRMPKNGDSITIDFNKAYNPYCAYNHKYSCPIPSAEDHIDTDIIAGVKKWH